MVNRRGFFGMIAALMAGIFAPKTAATLSGGVQPHIYRTPTVGTYDAINRATFTFWRSDRVVLHHFDYADPSNQPLLDMMHDAYKECR